MKTRGGATNVSTAHIVVASQPQVRHRCRGSRAARLVYQDTRLHTVGLYYTQKRLMLTRKGKPYPRDPILRWC